MNKSRHWLAGLLVAASAVAAFAVMPIVTAQTKPARPGDGVVRSLRSEGPVSAPEVQSDIVFRMERDSPPLPRDFVQQPPLIPHTIRDYNVTLNFNKCMDCHAWSRARETGATKISLTHFRDRDDKELQGISPRRYFCLQCHVPQTDANPLVDNTFKPAQALR